MKFSTSMVAVAAVVVAANAQDDSPAYQGEGFGFPLHGMTKKGGRLSPEDTSPGLPLESVTEEIGLLSEENREEFVNEDGITEEVITAEYKGEKKFGKDLDEWVKESRADFEKMMKNGRAHFDSDEDAAAWTHGKNRTLNTFGTDNRIALSAYMMDRFPYRASGHLRPVGCTGQMISKNVFLTNRHCILDSNGNLRYGNNFWSTMYLLLGRSDGTYNYKAYFNRAMWSNTKDWALVRTTYNVGSYTGYLGYRGRDWWYFVLNKRLTMLSYSGQFWSTHGRPGIHIGCSSRGAQLNGAIRHDCDAERGSSGSAMLEGVNSLWSYQSGGPWVVGVNYAEYRGGGSSSLHLSSYSNSYANLFIPGNTFSSKITQVRNQW